MSKEQTPITAEEFLEEKISIYKSKLWEKLESLRLTSDEELRTKYPISPQVGMGIDWDKWIEENL